MWMDKSKDYKQKYKWSPLGIELGLPAPRNCLACLCLPLMNVKTGQNDLWTGPRATCVPKKTVCKDNKKAVTGLMTPGLMTTRLKIKNIV